MGLNKHGSTLPIWITKMSFNAQLLTANDNIYDVYIRLLPITSDYLVSTYVHQFIQEYLGSRLFSSINC